jgi:UPF0755 protein
MHGFNLNPPNRHCKLLGMKRLLKLIVWLGAALILGGFLGLQYLDSWSTTKITIPGEVLVELRPGTPLKRLARQLETKELITSHFAFWLWTRLKGDFQKFQAGTYQINGDLAPQDIRTKMIQGDVYIPLILQVTIPEGFTLKMLNMRLATKNVDKLANLTTLVTSKAFIRSFGISANSLEGFTYPATYSFDKMPSGEDFYRKAVKTFFDKLPDQYEDQVKNRGLTLTQAVTFASLIELETMQEEEKPMIAEVIWSRLKKGEPLGIDAAIIYGIPDYDGDIRWKDLKDAKNLYNTRLHRGLPPSPIGAVSISSLEAVLNPTNLGYYYYMLDSADQTRHVFSKTLSEHNALVKKFLKSGASQIMRRNHEQEVR